MAQSHRNRRTRARGAKARNEEVFEFEAEALIGKQRGQVVEIDLAALYLPPGSKNSGI